jgi:cation:H+ antiporter
LIIKERKRKMAVNILLIALGFALLVKGADFLVDGASGVAKRFHIPEIIIGLTIVSIGTSMPELFVSITSAIDGYSDMAIGNVIGSNLCNLLLILGISAAINPIIFKKETKLIEIPICLGVSIVFLILANIGNSISRIDAIILIALFIGFICYTIMMAKKGEDFDEISEEEKQRSAEEGKKRKIIVNIIYIIVGIIALKIGGDLVVEHSEKIAKMFNVSDKIIGLTIVAIGTSLPELVTSVTAALKKNSDIAIGNIIGSNIFNMLLIIGAAAAISPMNYNTSYNLQMGILIIATIVLGIFPYTDRKDEMTISNGITYLMLYALYMAMLFAF